MSSPQNGRRNETVKTKTNRLPGSRPASNQAETLNTAELVQALNIDWSTIDRITLFLEVGLVAVDWALQVVVPPFQKACALLARIVSMILTSVKQVIEQNLCER